MLEIKMKNMYILIHQVIHQAIDLLKIVNSNMGIN